MSHQESYTANGLYSLHKKYIIAFPLHFTRGLVFFIPFHLLFHFFSSTLLLFLFILKTCLVAYMCVCLQYVCIFEISRFMLFFICYLLFFGFFFLLNVFNVFNEKFFVSTIIFVVVV